MLGTGNSKTVCKYGHPLTEENRVQRSAKLPNGRCRICRDANAKKWREDNLGRAQESSRKSRSKFRGEHPESYLTDWLHYKYNMTLERYKELLQEQDNRCAICHTLFDKSSRRTTPCVDHNHDCCAGERACGKCNRGLICGSCNIGLGAFKDNESHLQSAVKYLQKGA
jgi:hypothetical protein